MVNTTTVGLRHALNANDLFTLAFGSIIGVGWVAVVGAWIAQAGPLGAVIAFLGGMAVMLLVGLCYSELIVLFPVSGGEVTYAYEIGGIRFAFLVGWFLTANYVALCSFEMIAIPWIWRALAPQLSGPVVYRVLGHDVHAVSLMIGLTVMCLITFANYWGVKETGRLQSAATWIKVAVSIIFISAAFMSGNTANLFPLIATESVDGSLGWTMPILAIFAVAPFWYSGFDVVPQALGERTVQTSPRRVAKLLLVAIAAAGAFYTLIILATAMMLPREVLRDLELPAVQAFELALGDPLMGKLVLLAALLGLITVWNSSFFAATRILYSLGSIGALPRFLDRKSVV